MAEERNTVTITLDGVDVEVEAAQPLIDAAQMAGLEYIEHANGHFMLVTQHQCGCVHDTDLAFQRLVKGQAIEAGGILVHHRVRGVDTVDLGGLKQDFGVHLLCPENRRRVRSKVGITGTGAENHHPPFFQVPDRPAQNIGFGHFMHGDGGLDPGRRRRAVWKSTLACLW